MGMLAMPTPLPALHFCCMQAGRKALAHPEISTAAVAPFTQPGLFLRFDRDTGGCISLTILLHYISLQTSALRLVSVCVCALKQPSQTLACVCVHAHKPQRVASMC